MVTIGNIDVVECETPPRMTSFEETRRIFLNPLVTNEWRIRTDIRQRVEKASHTLPEDLCFMIFEGFRSRQRQRRSWDQRYAEIQRKHPDWSKEDLYTETSRWISPPDGFGSGHQAGAAVDLTLATHDRRALDMGTEMNEVTKLTPTAAPVADDIRKRREILISALATQGLVNYPDEWWHFSYGDRLWAEVTGRTKAFFAPID